MFFDCMPDITYETKRLGSIGTDIHTLACHLYKLFFLRGCLPDNKHT